MGDDDTGRLIDELRSDKARLQGDLEVLLAQLASLQAGHEQLRVELEAAKVEAALATAEVGHVQRQSALIKTHNERLEEQLAEAYRLCRQAEHERAAVISHLGRRAQRALSDDTNIDRTVT